jgi:glycosyltransferase involved in cell wall biosynthesis
MVLWALTFQEAMTTLFHALLQPFRYGIIDNPLWIGFCRMVDQRQMRILFVSGHSYMPQRVGGAENSTHELCRFALKNNLSVAVTCRYRGKWEKYAWGFRFFRRLPFSHRMIADNYQGYSVYRWRDAFEVGIRDAVEHFKPDIAVIQAGAPVRAAREIVRLGLPGIFYLRDVFFEEMGGTPFAHRLLCYVAATRFSADLLKSRFGISARVVPPLIDPARYRVEPTGNRVTLVGLDRKKGVEFAYRLARRCSHIPFLFVESWPLTRRRFTGYARRCRKAGNIDILRFTLDMKEVYRRTRVLIVPSQCEENWGRVVSEAQVSGIPALIADRGGLKESLGPGGIAMASDASVDEWAETLNRLWGDENHYRRLSGEACHHASRETFQPGHIYDFFHSIAQKHLDATRGPDGCIQNQMGRFRAGPAHGRQTT